MKCFLGRGKAENIFFKLIRINMLAFEMRLNDRKNRCFMLIVNNIIYLLVFLKPFFIICRHAAGYNRQGILVQFSGLIDHLPRFLVALVGNGTSVDHINICIFPEVNNMIIVFRKFRGNGIGFIQIQPATQCFKCDFLH